MLRFARLHYVHVVTTVPRKLIVYFTVNRRQEKNNVNLDEESSLLFSSEVILDAQFARVMTGIDHSDRWFMMVSLMSCVLKCFV